MPLKQTLQLPFSDDFPVHAQIRIEADGGEYVAYIQANISNWHQIHNELKQHDIDVLNSQLQKAIEKVSNCFDNNIQTSTEYDDALLDQAKKGNYVFKRIFAQGVPRELI